MLTKSSIIHQAKKEICISSCDCVIQLEGKVIDLKSKEPIDDTIVVKCPAKYTEQGDVPSNGCICLQAHAGEPYEIWYKNIVLNQIEQ